RTIGRPRTAPRRRTASHSAARTGTRTPRRGLLLDVEHVERPGRRDPSSDQYRVSTRARPDLEHVVAFGRLLPAPQPVGRNRMREVEDPAQRIRKRRLVVAAPTPRCDAGPDGPERKEGRRSHAPTEQREHRQEPGAERDEPGGVLLPHPAT